MTKSQLVKAINQIKRDYNNSWDCEETENFKIIVEDIDRCNRGMIGLNVAVYNADTNKYIDAVEFLWLYFENDKEEIEAEKKIEKAYNKLVKMIDEL